MPRGSNSEVETGRVSADEVSKERGEGKRGSGVGVDGFGPGNKKGFGSGSMQKNPASMKKPSF